MVCPGCGHENPKGSRKCAACSLPLATKGQPEARMRQVDGPEEMQALGGEPLPVYREVPTVQADPESGFLGKPLPDAIGDRSRFQGQGPTQALALGRTVAVGARAGAVVAAFLGFLASLVAVGIQQGASPDPGSPLPVFMICFLRYLSAGILGGAIIGVFVSLLGDIGISWLVGVPLGILFWAVFQLPTTLISNQSLAGPITLEVVVFAIAGGGFGHLVGRLLHSGLSWD